MSTKLISNDQREFQEQNAATDQRNLNSDRWEALCGSLDGSIKGKRNSAAVITVKKRKDDYAAYGFGKSSVGHKNAVGALTALADLLIAKRYERGEGT